MARVLVVDDERGMRITLTEFLKEDNYEVHQAADAQAAVELIQSMSFEVVITDIFLPRTSGVDLVRRISQLSSFTKVILITGQPAVETAAEALRAGAFDYLSKPVSKTTILQVVRSAVRITILEQEKNQLEAENLNYRRELERQVDLRTSALLESEEKHVALFESMPVGFGYFRVIQNEAGDVVDFEFLELNHEFESIFGMSEAETLYHCASEVLPGLDNGGRIWLERFAHVAISGETARYEFYADHVDCWYYVTVFCPKPGYFVTLFDDITALRK